MKPAIRAASVALGLAIGAAGAWVAWLLAVPAQFILGPAIAVTVAGVSGLRTDMPAPLRNAAFVVIGAIMGSGVTPGVLDAARKWPLSFLVLGASLVVIMGITAVLFRRFWGYDRTTAVLSSAPGHLSFVIGLGAETGGNLAAISIVQSIRLLCLTLFVPVIVAAWGFGDAAHAGSVPAVAMSLPQLAAMLPACLGAGYALNRLRMPAGFLIGAMLVSTVLHLTGSVQGVVPDWLAVPCFIAMGTMIGARFSGVRAPELFRYSGAGLLATAIAVAIAGAAAALASSVTGIALGPMLIAFAPGGVETMAAIALLVNADPAFVAAHHMMRLFILTGLIPLFLGRSAGRI